MNKYTYNKPAMNLARPDTVDLKTRWDCGDNTTSMANIERNCNQLFSTDGTRSACIDKGRIRHRCKKNSYYEKTPAKKTTFISDMNKSSQFPSKSSMSSNSLLSTPPMSRTSSTNSNASSSFSSIPSVHSFSSTSSIVPPAAPAAAAPAAAPVAAAPKTGFLGLWGGNTRRRRNKGGKKSVGGRRSRKSRKSRK
jgi:hypothetical protein